MAKRLQAHGKRPTVIVFRGGGGLESELREAGILVRTLGKRGRWDVVRFLVRLTYAIRTARPDVIYGFLPMPNLLSLAVSRIPPRTRVAWA